MNKRYIKIGVITLVSLGAIYGGYKLYKYLSKPTEEDATLPTEDVIETLNKEEVTQISKPNFDGNKIISKGSTGDEAKTIQKALNNIINDVKKILKTKIVTNYKIKQISELSPLTVNGIFDAKSTNNLTKIMGKSSASYNQVRNKRLDISKNYSMGNPYSK